MFTLFFVYWICIYEIIKKQLFCNIFHCPKIFYLEDKIKRQKTISLYDGFYLKIHLNSEHFFQVNIVCKDKVSSELYSWKIYHYLIKLVNSKNSLHKQLIFKFIHANQL